MTSLYAPSRKWVLHVNGSLTRTNSEYELFYFRGHIPQSVFFDLWKCVESTEYIPRNLPDKNCFEDYAQTLGISPDTHIVAYDRSSPLSSYRTWWLFRVYYMYLLYFTLIPLFFHVFGRYLIENARERTFKALWPLLLLQLQVV